MNEQTLAGRFAVVTGASRGIGRAIALALAEEGADVLVHAGANRREAEETAAAVREGGREADTVVLDLAESAAHDRLVETAWRDRPVDIWVNNAGVDVLTGPAAQWSFEEKLAALWRVDVLATIRLSRLTGARMIEREAGVILNMSWDQAAYGMPGESGEMFAAVKGAVAAFSRSLAASLAPQVRVNCLAPGWIKTAWGEQASEDWQRLAEGQSLLARWGTPEDVARVACFLASDAAGFVTGQVVEVNGGMRR